MNAELFQTRFVELLKLKIGDQKNWADELVSVLNVTKPSIYRKIKPETFFSVRETLILSKHYKISIDQLILQNSDQVQFDCPNMVNPIGSIEEYLTRLIKSFERLGIMKVPKIYYATRELPIFYYFLDDVYAAFKLYVFARTIWLVPRFKSARFDFKLFSPDNFKTTKAIWNNYSGIISEEYWNSNILDNTLHQIQYFFESGDLSLKDANEILDSMIRVMNLCREMALRESKSHHVDKNLTIYNNRILHTGNHVLVRSDEMDVLYLTYDSPNFLITEDVQFTKYSIDWYKLINENSYTLGKGAGHHNANFFKSLLDNIEALRVRLI